jgi:hypothetical protein
MGSQRLIILLDPAAKEDPENINTIFLPLTHLHFTIQPLT